MSHSVWKQLIDLVEVSDVEIRDGHPQIRIPSHIGRTRIEVAPIILPEYPGIAVH